MAVDGVPTFCDCSVCGLPCRTAHMAKPVRKNQSRIDIAHGRFVAHWMPTEIVYGNYRHHRPVCNHCSPAAAPEIREIAA